MRVVSFSHPLCDGSLVYPQPQAAQGAARIPSFFDDGPVMFAGNRREEVLGRMVEDVLKHEAHGSIDDARRLLHALNIYNRIDVGILAPEALVLARQFVETQGMVEREILDNAT